jgi:CRAL/TRIO domain
MISTLKSGLNSEYFSQDGRPVYIEQLGKVDLTAMYKITTQERMLQNLVVEYEKLDDPRLPACSRKADHLLETCCTIMDLKGVGLSKAGSVYGYVQRASAISQNYYPERLGKLYVINAPWGFSTVFSVVKSFLDPVTVNKIHVLGSGYITELLAQVETENLPEFLGGTCTCEDHGGCMFSDMGPWQDPKWVKEPAWAKKDDKGKDAKGTITQVPQEEAEKKEAEAGGKEEGGVSVEGDAGAKETAAA